MASDWAGVLVTLLLGIAGFAISLSVWRDVRVKVTDRRLDAYARLWEILAASRPNDPPLGDSGRRLLQRRLSDWYYTKGQGMTLGRDSRSLFFQAKDNLTEITPKRRQPTQEHDSKEGPAEQRPTIDAVGLTGREIAHGRLSRRQLSLLRTQLRADLSLFGRPYGEELSEDDKTFLLSAGIPPVWGNPWSDWTFRRSPWRRWPWQRGGWWHPVDPAQGLFDDAEEIERDHNVLQDDQTRVTRDVIAAGFRLEAADADQGIESSKLTLVSVDDESLVVDDLAGVQGVLDWLDSGWPPAKRRDSCE